MPKKIVKSEGGKPAETSVAEKETLQSSAIKKPIVKQNTTDEIRKPPVQCWECNKILKNKNTLYAHMNRLHSDVKTRKEKIDQASNYPCRLCGKNYGHRKNLRIHKIKFHSQPKRKVSQCSLCWIEDAISRMQQKKKCRYV